jgi:histidine ammonia-lyase
MMSDQLPVYSVELDGEHLTIEDVVAVARNGRPVAPLSPAVKDRMMASAQWVERTVQEDARIVYGVNTGFGPLASQRVARDDTRTLSYNVVVACGVGVDEPHPEDAVRAAMLIHANGLAKGFSGVRPVVADTIIAMLNAGVTPLVPAKGSVGASGDLAPLAHIAMVLSETPVGRAHDSGFAWCQGERLPGHVAMARAGIPRVVLEAKEGLSLTNGTGATTGLACLATHDAWNLLHNAEAVLATSLEALHGFTDAFDEHPHQARAHRGQQETAHTVRRLVDGSQMVNHSPYEDSDSPLSLQGGGLPQPGRVQDAYSLRCAPQVLGAVRDALRYITGVVDTEINATTDNPLIFTDLDRENKAMSAGNFHAEPLAFAMDLLSIVMAEVANISERRLFRLTTPELSNGLPSMLVKNPGLNTGFMVPHCTAAALVSDNKTLAHPDSVDSIPTAANQEDFVSMAPNAARHAREIIRNGEMVVAIELLAAVQALDLRPPHLERGLASQVAHELVRQRAPMMEQDCSLFQEMAAVAELIHSGQLLQAIALKAGSTVEDLFC